MIRSMSELARRLSKPRTPPRPPLRAVTAAPIQETAQARLRRMVDEHHAFIWRNLRRIGTVAADADELVQEAFLVASRRLADIQPGCERSFLMTTAIRIAANHRRSFTREQARIEYISRVDSDGTPNPEEALQREQARERLDQVLAAMELDLRSVFVLYEIEELTVPQIAELLDMKLGTVSSRLRRAREAFQTLTASPEDRRVVERTEEGAP
jgi:RNA polymerase sigma-70 factor (ECF subfamily)